MNSLYILIILLLIPFLCFIIEKIFSDKYKNIEANSKLTGFEVSRKLLDSYDMKDIYIVEINFIFTLMSKTLMMISKLLCILNWMVVYL